MEKENDKQTHTSSISLFDIIFYSFINCFIKLIKSKIHTTITLQPDTCMSGGLPQKWKRHDMKLLLCTLGLCDLDYIHSLRLDSISFVKLGFVNHYPIHKLFFTFKDHLHQAPINIFIKSQIENIPCFVAHTVSVVTIQVTFQYKSSRQYKWMVWLCSQITLFIDTVIWMSCNFHKMFFCFFSQPFKIVKIIPKAVAIQTQAVSWIWPTGHFAKP